MTIYIMEKTDFEDSQNIHVKVLIVLCGQIIDYKLYIYYIFIGTWLYPFQAFRVLNFAQKSSFLPIGYNGTLNITFSNPGEHKLCYLFYTVTR